LKGKQMFTALDRIAAARSAPLTHRVTTTYADGAERTHDTRSADTAENYAFGERNKIGRKLIDRETQKTVTVVAVTVAPIA
jgi:hypothetical protein